MMSRPQIPLPWPEDAPPRNPQDVATLFFRHEDNGHGPISTGPCTLNGPLIAKLLMRERPHVFTQENVQLLFEHAHLTIDDKHLGGLDFSRLLGFDHDQLHDDYYLGVWMMKDWLTRDDKYIITRDFNEQLQLEVVKSGDMRWAGALRRELNNYLVSDVVQVSGEPHDPKPKHVRMQLEPGGSAAARNFYVSAPDIQIKEAEGGASFRGTRPHLSAAPRKSLLAAGGFLSVEDQEAISRSSSKAYSIDDVASDLLGDNDSRRGSKDSRRGTQYYTDPNAPRPDLLVTCMMMGPGKDNWGPEEARIRMVMHSDDFFIGDYISDQFGVRFSIKRGGDGSMIIYWLQYAAVLVRDSPWLVGHSMGADGKSRKKIRIYPREDDNGLCMQYLEVARKTESIWSTPPTRMRRLTDEEHKADGRYVDTASMWQALNTGDTVLLKGRWIVERNREDEPLPRRQELPPDAIWDPDELEAHVRQHDVQIVALSYCWEEEDHPDPYGRQLEMLAGVIERRLELKFPNGRPALYDVAIFIDWCSLYQRPHNSMDEASSFARGLEDCYLWFAHQTTECWLLQAVAPGMVPYEDRGWPYFEVEISSMITPQHMLINIGKWRTNISDWFRLYQACRMERSVPETPNDFLEDLRKRRFTHQEDLSFLEKKYSQVFEEVIGSAQVLSFSEITHWEARNWELFSHMLPLCRKLKRFSMVGDRLHGADFKQIAAVLPQCVALKVLELSSNPIGDEGVKALSSSLPQFPSIEMLVLEDCEIKDKGAMALAAALPGCARLQELWLSHNQISTAGCTAMTKAIPDCPPLRVLLLADNSIGTNPAARLKEAWLAAGKLDNHDDQYNLDTGH